MLRSGITGRALLQRVAQCCGWRRCRRARACAQRVSIANTAIALVAAPLIVTYADVSYVTRVGLATSLALFGVLTTGAAAGLLAAA